MFDFNKHYIRVENEIVVKGFSDAFELPLETDICINAKGGRHFELNGVINPPLYTERGCHIYRYDTKLRKATEAELDAEWQAIKPKEQPSEMERLKNYIAELEAELTNTQLALCEIYEKMEV